MFKLLSFGPNDLRCSYAGHVVPCFEPVGSCNHHNFPTDGPPTRAFVFSDDLQRPAEWLNNLQESYMIHLLQKWAKPNHVDVVLILPSPTIAKHRITVKQRLQLRDFGVVIKEVPWIRPELGSGIPRWAQEFWCVDRDFFKLHALGLEYEAVIFYDSDVYVDPKNFEPLEDQCWRWVLSF